MPDPKAIVAVGAFLDISEFPAVGNKDAFVRHLENYRGNALMIDLLLSCCDDLAMYTNIFRWIGGKSSQVQVRDRPGRGIIKADVDKLKNGSTNTRRGALAAILATGDGAKIVDVTAGQLARVARSTASSRV